MSIRMLRKLKEKLFPKGQTIVSSAGGGFWGETEKPSIDRKKCVELYKTNPLAKQAIDLTVSDAIGGGYFTECSDEEAKRLVDAFAEKVRLDELLILAVRDMLVTGDGTLERIYSDEHEEERRIVVDGKERVRRVIAPVKGAKLVGLKWVPAFTLEVARSKTGKVLWWKQEVEYKTLWFAPEKILDFRWNPTGLSYYGTSELEPVFNLLQDIDDIQDAFVKIIKRYAAPPIIWKAKGLSKEELERHKQTVEEKEPGEDLYINTDLIEPMVLDIDPRGRFENYYNALIKAVIVGLQTPTLTQFEETSRAAASTLMEFYAKKIDRIRRVVKRVVEHEIFEPIVRQAGRREVPKLRWNVLSKTFRMTGPELTLELFDRNLYSPSQTKKMLQKYGVEFPPEGGEEREEG